MAVSGVEAPALIPTVFALLNQSFFNSLAEVIQWLRRFSEREISKSRLVLALLLSPQGAP